MRHLTRKEIDSRLTELTYHLNVNKRHIDNNVGWHQHLGSAKIGIVATAIALIHYKNIGEECEEQEQCLQFLVSQVRDDGGWSYISNANNVSNVESTCWALLALHRYDRVEFHDIVNNGIHWILNTIDNHNQDNGWPFASGSPARIYITALTLRVLYELQRSDTPEFESARHWLINAANEDGGWGALPEDGSSLFFTSFCITTLIEIGEDRKSPTLRRAFKWLKDRTRHLNMESPSFECYLEFIENGEGPTRIRIPFFHYVLPHVIIAFIKMNDSDSILLEFLYALYSKSKDGLIEHPDLENSKIYPIWALYDTALAFNTFKDRYDGDWNKKYLFTGLFGRLCAIRWYNPLVLIAITPNWLWSCFVVFGVSLLIFLYGSPIIAWANNLGSGYLVQILLSLVASIIYGVGSGLISYITRLKDKSSY